MESLVTCQAHITSNSKASRTRRARFTNSVKPSMRKEIVWFFEENAANLAPILSLWMGIDPLVEVAHIEDRDVWSQQHQGVQENPD